MEVQYTFPTCSPTGSGYRVSPKIQKGNNECRKIHWFNGHCFSAGALQREIYLKKKSCTIVCTIFYTNKDIKVAARVDSCGHLEAEKPAVNTALMWHHLFKRVWYWTPGLNYETNVNGGYSSFHFIHLEKPHTVRTQPLSNITHITL